MFILYSLGFLGILIIIIMIGNNIMFSQIASKLSLRNFTIYIYNNKCFSNEILNLMIMPIYIFIYKIYIIIFFNFNI